jgi:hypothetical protein
MFSGKLPDCISCGFVIVIPENYTVVELLDTYQSCFIDGMGGINPEGIDKVLEWENIEKDITLIQKILIYLIVSSKKRSEERDGTKNRARVLDKR